MPDSTFALNSTGTRTDFNIFVAGQNGSNTGLSYVETPVPGVLLTTSGVGQFSVTHGGLRGSLTAEITVGATGSARAVLKLTSALSSPLATVQISLDTSNRPVATIAYEGLIKASSPSGSAIPAGTQLRFRLVWDSRNALTSGNFVDFNLLAGGMVPGTLGSLPVAAWPMIGMGFVQVGYGTGLSDFNGTIQALQVGDQRV